MCGIIGISSSKSGVIRKIIIGNYNQQHRGQQASGAATFDGKLRIYRGSGLVKEVFNKVNRQEWLRLKGKCGIGHNLYSTIGRGGTKKQPRTFQPLVGVFGGVPFALGHNGNLVDLDGLRKKARRAGYTFKSEDSDTEVIVALLSVSKQKDFLSALREVLPQLKGAFSLVILYREKIIGVRDANGIRPLCIGHNNDSYIIASESCAFYDLGAHIIREIEPGEVVVLGNGKIEKSFQWTDKTQLRGCIFEHVYFARPDSYFMGRSVSVYRRNAGIISAKENPVDADISMPVPESGRIYDHGFSAESTVPIQEGLFRNRYGTVKTFLAPRDIDRKKLQIGKLHPLKAVMSGKKICLIEDSLVRASVLPKTISDCRTEGAATKVHVRICSAPIKHRCHLGIDMATRKELTAAIHTVDEIRDNVICADSLGYLSIEGMLEALDLPKENLCMGCFTGEYPVEPPKE